MTPALRSNAAKVGAVAEHGHLPGWQTDPRFTIVAVAEPQPARRAQASRLLPTARICASVAEALATNGLDFVDIASPPAFHAETIVAAARAGLHVLCEKPLVTTSAEYMPVRAAVTAAGVVLHPVHNWKQADAFRELKVLAANGIGRLRELEFLIERDGWSVSAGDWRAVRRLGGGGILVDHGWHAFYLALALTDATPQAVRAGVENRRYRDTDVEDTAHCEFEFGDCRVAIDLTWAGRERRSTWTLRGSGGEVEIRDATLRTVHGDGAQIRELGTSLSAGSHHPDWFPGVLDSFAAAIASPALRGAAQREAEWCLAMLEAAYASAAADGQRVEIRPPLP